MTQPTTAPLLREWNSRIPKSPTTPTTTPTTTPPRFHSPWESKNGIPVATFLGNLRNVADQIRSRHDNLVQNVQSAYENFSPNPNSYPESELTVDSDFDDSQDLDEFEVDPGRRSRNRNRNRSRNRNNGEVRDGPSFDDPRFASSYGENQNQNPSCLPNSKGVNNLTNKFKKLTRRKGPNTNGGSFRGRKGSKDSRGGKRGRKGSKDGNGRRERKGSKDVLSVHGKENNQPTGKPKKNRGFLSRNSRKKHKKKVPFDQESRDTTRHDDGLNFYDTNFQVPTRQLIDRSDPIIQADDVHVASHLPPTWDEEKTFDIFRKEVTNSQRLSNEDCFAFRDGQTHPQHSPDRNVFHVFQDVPTEDKSISPNESIEPLQTRHLNDIGTDSKHEEDLDSFFAKQELRRRQTSFDISLDEVIEEAKSVLSHEPPAASQNDPARTVHAISQSGRIPPSDPPVSSPSSDDGTMLDISVKNRVEDIESQIQTIPLDPIPANFDNKSQCPPSSNRGKSTKGAPPPQIMFDDCMIDKSIFQKPMKVKGGNVNKKSWSKNAILNKVTDIAAEKFAVTKEYLERGVSSSLSSSQEESNMSEEVSREENNMIKRGGKEGKNALKVVFLGSQKGDILNRLVQEGADYEASSDSTQKKMKIRQSYGIYLNVQRWAPTVPKQNNFDIEKLQFSLWDLQGADLEPSSHCTTQTLCLSSNSLYVIVWHVPSQTTSNDDSDDDGYISEDNYFGQEIQAENMDQSINRDINVHVTQWIDLISKHAPEGSAVLPVISCEDSYTRHGKEMKRRCDILKERLSAYTRLPQILLGANKEISIVSKNDGGTAQLRDALINIARNSHLGSSFKHLNSELPPVTVAVQNIICQFKKEGLEILPIGELWSKLIESPPQADALTETNVSEALKFLSSTGEILFFERDGSQCSDPNTLSNFIILKPSWMTSVVSCILQKDFFLNKLNILGNEPSDKEYIGSALKGGSSCSIVSADDAANVWKETAFISKTHDKISHVDSKGLYFFLQQVCEHCGIFTPLNDGDREVASGYYLVPAWCEHAVNPPSCFKTGDHLKSTLCQSWLLKEEIPVGFFDKILASLLEQLRAIVAEGSSEHYGDKVNSQIDVIKVMCWKSSFHAKLVEVSTNTLPGGVPKKSSVDIFAGLVERDSPHCPASKSIASGRKLFVSARGNSGAQGEPIWSSGYSDILDSVEKIMTKTFGDRVEREVVCPDCLANSDPRRASAWKMEGAPICDWSEPIECRCGHLVSPQLLFGCGGHNDLDTMTSMTSTTCNSVSTINTFNTTYTNRTEEYHVERILPSIMLVGLWDCDNNEVVNVGSGFMADSSRGLIISAAHIFYDMEINKPVGRRYKGFKNAKAIIGTMPYASNGPINQVDIGTAQFLYSAELLRQDRWSVDACVLKITSKFQDPVKCIGTKLDFSGGPWEDPITAQSMKKERFQSLKITRQARFNECISIIGFYQTGDGIVHMGQHINQTCNISHGYVSKIPPQASQVRRWKKKNIYSPRSEIEVGAKTLQGHSGGPCINRNNEVIGIVSRINPNHNHFCFLAPAIELKKLLKEAQRA